MVRKLLGLLVTLIFTSAVSYGQSEYGRLEGTVTDAKSGEPVVGVNVTLKVSGSTKGSVTNEEGDYELTAIPPGKYDVTYSDVRYGRKILKDVEIGQGRTTVKDVTLSSDEKTLDIVDVEAHKGLFKKDKTTGSKNFDSESISKMPTKSINDVISLNTAISTKAGGLSIQGQRSSGTVVKVDGVRVRGLRGVPQRSIQNINTITSGIPAKHGDATGGVISITTKGGTPTYTGTIEMLSSQFLDGYGFNQLEGNISGPIYKKYKGTDSSSTKLSFQFGGVVTSQDEPRPTVIDHKVVKDDVLSSLKEEPLVRDPRSAGFQPNAAFVTDEQMKTVSSRPNVDRFNYSFTGKLNYNLSDQINLIAGGQYGYRTNQDFSRASSMFNYNNYSDFDRRNFRTYVRMTQSFANDDNDQEGIRNVFYSLQASYEKNNRVSRNEQFGEDFFKYGYYGEFDRKRAPNYIFTEDSVGGTVEEAFFQQGFRDTAVEFTPAGINQTAANYTEQLYKFQDGNVTNLQQISGLGGLRNGDAPQLVYNLWTNVGDPVGGYGKFERQTFRANADGSFDIGEHSISLGLQYEQIVRRGFNVGAQSLWTVARQSVNSHIRQLDTDNPQPVFNNGTFTDTVRYERLDEGGQTTFDKRLREQEDIGPKEFINIDEYKPEDLSLGLFGADELLNQNQVGYFGYDYKGNKISEDPSIEDFLNNPDTRPMGAYTPNYTSAYIQDKFQVKDLFFRLGVRVDRFDANQPVPKDKFSLFPTRKKDNVDGELNPSGEHPGNVPDRSVVYVDDPFDPNEIVGYRKGDNWFNNSGESVVNPNSIALETRTGEISPYLAQGVDEEDNLVPEGFEEYEPQVTVMPRIAFSFPISQEARFRASYDVLTQRPKSRIQTTIDDFYYLEDRATQTINNPNLKPQRSNKFTLGFKQKLTRKSSFEIKGFYTETRNMIQIQQISQAYPTTYTTFRNIDFSTTKGLTAIYDIRATRRSPVSFRGSYTLQFADGTGSGTVSQSALIEAGQPNLRTPFPLNTDIRHNFQGILDYRFRSGAGYNGPVTGDGTQLLKNVGINLRLSAQSGQPYSQQGNVTQAVSIGIRQRQVLEGDINGARLPWTYTANLRIDKRIPIDWGGKDKGQGPSSGGRQDNINIYLRIDNLLSTKNVRSVYRYTGSPDDDGFLSSLQGQQVISQQVSQQAFRDQYRAKVNNPFNYQRPRIIRLGAQLNF